MAKKAKTSVKSKVKAKSRAKAKPKAVKTANATDAHKAHGNGHGLKANIRLDAHEVLMDERFDSLHKYIDTLRDYIGNDCLELKTAFLNMEIKVENFLRFGTKLLISLAFAFGLVLGTIGLHYFGGLNFILSLLP